MFYKILQILLAFVVVGVALTILSLTIKKTVYLGIDNPSCPPGLTSCIDTPLNEIREGYPLKVRQVPDPILLNDNLPTYTDFPTVYYYKNISLDVLIWGLVEVVVVDGSLLLIRRPQSRTQT